MPETTRLTVFFSRTSGIGTRHRAPGTELFQNLPETRDYDSNLASGVPRAMREEPIVIALGAEPADGDLLDAGLGRVLRDQRA